MTAQNVLITGGSKGIGYGIAEFLLEKGLNVAITSRTKEAADKAKELLEQKNKGKVLAFEADVRDLAKQEEVVAQVVAAWGSLDVVVANAGLGYFANIEEMDPQKFQDVMDINVTGVFNSTKASVEALKASKGYLITIASLAGTNFFPMGAAYNASKFAVVGFTQSVMLDLRAYDIKVTTIMPGSVTSHFNGHTPSEEDSWKIQPEDLGLMVYQLLEMNPRTLPSKIEVRPTNPNNKPKK